MELDYHPLTLTDFFSAYGIEKRSHRWPWTEGTLRSCFGMRYINGMVLLDGHMAGFYIADLVAGDSSLMNICIDPRYQGKKIGQKLLAHYLADSSARGATAWFLEVRVSNAAAIHLYEQADFVEYCRRLDYYDNGIHREDAILMLRQSAWL